MGIKDERVSVDGDDFIKKINEDMREMELIRAALECMPDNIEEDVIELMKAMEDEENQVE